MLESTGYVVLAALTAFIFFAAFFGRWLLGPVNQAAGHLNAPTRFILTDFLWLMIELQVMLGMVLVQIREQFSARAQFFILGILGVLVTVLWAASVSVVSRAGITQPLRRAVLILVIVPGALVEMVAPPLLLIAASAALASRPGDWVSVYWSDSFSFRLFTLLAAAMGAVIWALALRWLSHWVLAQPQPPAVAAQTGGELPPSL